MMRTECACLDWPRPKRSRGGANRRSLSNDAHDALSGIFLAPFSIHPASNQKLGLSATWTADRLPSGISVDGDGRVSSPPRHLVEAGHGNSDDERKTHDAVDAYEDDDAGCPLHFSMRKTFCLDTCSVQRPNSDKALRRTPQAVFAPIRSIPELPGERHSQERPFFPVGEVSVLPSRTPTYDFDAPHLT